MKNLIDLLKTLKETPLTILLVAFGLAGIALGVIGKIGSWVSLEERYRKMSRDYGSLSFLLGLSLGFGQWLVSRGWPTGYKLEEYVGVILISALGLATLFGIVILRNRLNDLIEAENHLVANVEDATRHLLRGFPQIFDRALQLIAEAEREIWIVNFALNFGGPHCCSDKKSRLFFEVTDVYNKLPLTPNYPFVKLGSRDFARDVSKLFVTLNDKVASMPIVNILTVNDEGAMANFLIPLSKRPRYQKTYTPEKLNSVFGELTMRRKEILDRMKKGRDRAWDEEVNHEAIFCETGSMPIQLLIAGTKSGRNGCLVFMVGTEILQGLAGTEGLDPGDADSQLEFGFYTELDDIVKVYRGLAHALIKQAETEYAKEGRLPPYKEPSVSVTSKPVVATT